MGEKFCLDKRVAYLGFFTGILLLIVIISTIVNNTKLSQNSKASEPTPSIVLSTAPAMKSACLSIKESGTVATPTLELSVFQNPGFDSSKQIGIYAVSNGTASLLTYGTLPTGVKTGSLTTIKTSLLLKGQTTSFLATQINDNEKDPGLMPSLMQNLVEQSQKCSAYRTPNSD